MMFSPRVTLREEENLVEVVRRHWTRSKRSIIKAALLFLLAFFLVAPLFRYGEVGVFVFLALLVAALFLTLREVFRWQRTAIVLTTHRVLLLEQYGFFDRDLVEVPYQKLVDVRFRMKGVGQSVGGYGTLHILVEGMPEAIEITHIPLPERVHRLVMALREDSRAENDES